MVGRVVWRAPNSTSRWLLYDLRSEVVHRGKFGDVEAADLKLARDYAKSAITRLLSLRPALPILKVEKNINEWLDGLVLGVPSIRRPRVLPP